MFFWGWVFIVTTTLVLIFKHEVDHSAVSHSDEPPQVVMDGSPSKSVLGFEIWSAGILKFK
jgi:hypothetical protein